MADGGPPAPQPPPVVPLAPPVQIPTPPAHLIVPAAQPIASPIELIQPAPMQQLHWSHFKPKFTGKPDEDVEAHLRTSDRKITHVFPEGVKSPTFLSNISRRGMLMVQIIKVYTFRLEWVTKSVLTAIFQDRQ